MHVLPFANTTTDFEMHFQSYFFFYDETELQDTQKCKSI